MNIHIKNGRVIDPANACDAVKDVYIANGQIQSVGEKPAGFVAQQSIDASNKWVLPGFVDLNASLREPGYEHKATIQSETKAAVSAGYTSICCLPDTQPVLDTPSVVQLILDKAALAGSAKVLPLGALTVGLQGKALSEMYALKKAGCVAVSQAPNNTIDNQILRRALQYASTHDLLVILKPEDISIKDDGCIHDGSVSSKLGLSGIPVSAETVAIAQMIELAEETGARIHLTGVSSARAVTMIARAQATNDAISADVHAYQLSLTEFDVGTFDANYHTSPPLRSVEDRDALVAGVAKGMLRLVDEGILDLSQMVSRLTDGPSVTLGLATGRLSEGAPADLCIVDPDKTWLVDEEHWFSQGINTPYLGHQMKGKVTHTLVNGHLVFEE